MTRPNGVHHLAISTASMKEQLTFFTQVMGMELVGLFWMHGVDGGWHAFLELNETCSLAFVCLPDNAKAARVIGQTHAANGAGASAGGTMQHLAFNVDTEAELLAMRDRIRAHGHPVFGPADHGMCKSIYFAGPEGLTLEVANSDGAIDGDMWIDPEVAELAGISAVELAAMRNPSRELQPNSPVPQPEFDPDKYHMGYPEVLYQAMLKMSDEGLMERMSYSEPPVPAK